jgi:hypothetical protein
VEAFGLAAFAETAVFHIIHQDSFHNFGRIVELCYHRGLLHTVENGCTFGNLGF